VKRHATLFVLLVGFAVDSVYAQTQSWQDSIVVIESNIVEYSYYEPWSNTARTISKNGVVVVGNRVLTTADWMQNTTHVRMQKRGRGRWWNAKLEWVDYHANLAALSVDDTEFWDGLEPVTFSASVPKHGEVQIYRQTGGNLETWNASVSKVFVAQGQRSFVRHMMLELSSDVDSSGWSEVVAHGDEVVGLAASQDSDRLLAIPAPLITGLLEAKAKNPDAGFSFYDFVWQFTRNKSVTALLGLQGPARGIVVTRVPASSAFAGVLEPRDIILEIDGFPIDLDGDYEDPVYGHLSFRNLATRDRFAGDDSTFLVWRDGHTVSVNVTLPAARYEDALVPAQVFDRTPQYLIVGGLIFQPLTTDYLRSWGSEWWKTAPYRFGYYTYQESTTARPHLVVLSHLLADRFNLGYQDLSYLAVDKVNDIVVTDLNSLKAALTQPQDGFHVIEFFSNTSAQKVVLDATKLPAATQKILANYGISREFVIH
jgi:hypothetical protein